MTASDALTPSPSGTSIEITEAQREQMNVHGYIILQNVFSQLEMQTLDSALQDYFARIKRDDPRAREVEFTQKIAERDPVIQAFAQRDEFVSISTALLGPDTDLYFNQSVYKNPHGTTPFSWHQDDAYGPVEPSPYLTVWIAINDATQENGCISVMPGSHTQGLVPHFDSEFGLACYGHEESDQGFLVQMQAGSIAIFWSLTMHKSGPNTTDGVRKAMVLQFAPLGLRHKASGMPIRSRIPVSRNGYPGRMSY